MEELRSTEALDNEIRNDARKRAAKILEKADESAAALLNGVAQKVAEAQEDARKQSDARLALYKKNIDASIPLEKERYLVSYIYDSVMAAINSYFNEIGEDKRMQVIASLLERSMPALGGKDVSAIIIGYNETKAKKLLKKYLGKNLTECSQAEKYVLNAESIKGLEFREGFIIKALDGSVTCRLTLDEKVKEILDDENYELSSTLFCGRLPE